MKKILAIAFCVVIICGIFIACATNSDKDKTTTQSTIQSTSAPATEKKLKIVTTIFPEYDWVKQILGSNAANADITMLLDSGVDLHSYQPTAEDILKISDCDMFVYVGGESDEWVDSALESADNKNMKVINLLDVLGDSVKDEETVEGMQEEEHEHSHDEEIKESDIEDRELSDFDGEWKSLYPYLINGDLDEYCEHKAEDDDDEATTKKTFFEKYKASWQCDVENITIDGSEITFKYTDGKTVTGNYTYSGFTTINDDDGKIKSVRYQFKTDDNNAPKFVQFNDHGHEPGKAEHFHIYFGNESFAALTDSETNPFFVKNELSTEEILDELMGHEAEKDEHVWLSLKNAETLVAAISDALQELDPDNKSTYVTNTNTYVNKLSDLDAEYQKAVNNATYKTVLFGDRFPFRYLVDDYGLSYYAAFVGCSAETEASFETVKFLAEKVDELKLPCVLTIEGTNHDIAETIVSNTKSKNAKIYSMDSLQSTTSADIEDGKTYLGAMENNLSVLKSALG